MASALLRKLMAPPVIPSVAPTSSNLMRDAVQGLRPPTPYVRFDMLRLVRRNEVRPAVVACHTAMKLHAPPPPEDLVSLLELTLRIPLQPSESMALRPVVDLLARTADALTPQQFSAVLLATARSGQERRTLVLAEAALRQGWTPLGDDRAIVAIIEAIGALTPSEPSTAVLGAYESTLRWLRALSPGPGPEATGPPALASSGWVASALIRLLCDRPLTTHAAAPAPPSPGGAVKADTARGSSGRADTAKGGQQQQQQPDYLLRTALQLVSSLPDHALQSTGVLPELAVAAARRGHRAAAVQTLSAMQARGEHVPVRCYNELLLLEQRELLAEADSLHAEATQLNRSTAAAADAAATAAAAAGAGGDAEQAGVAASPAAAPATPTRRHSSNSRSSSSSSRGGGLSRAEATLALIRDFGARANLNTLYGLVCVFAADSAVGVAAARLDAAAARAAAAELPDDSAAQAAAEAAAAALAAHPRTCDGVAAFVERTAAALGLPLHQRVLGAAAFACIRARNAAEARRVITLAQAAQAADAVAAPALPKWRRVAERALAALDAQEGSKHPRPVLPPRAAARLR